jgi:hypothetical protein
VTDDEKKGSLLPAAIGGVLVGAGAVLALSNKKVRRLAFTALEKFLGLSVVEKPPEAVPPEPEKKEGGE